MGVYGSLRDVDAIAGLAVNCHGESGLKLSMGWLGNWWISLQVSGRGESLAPTNNECLPFLFHQLSFPVLFQQWPHCWAVKTFLFVLFSFLPFPWPRNCTPEGTVPYRRCQQQNQHKGQQYLCFVGKKVPPSLPRTHAYCTSVFIVLLFQICFPGSSSFQLPHQKSLWHFLVALSCSANLANS
jgi:hypothetical protein